MDYLRAIGKTAIRLAIDKGNPQSTHKEQLAESREVDYRLSKWIITNIEQLLEPDEIEEIWRELLSFYSPPTASVENVCGTMTGGGLGKYVAPARTMNKRKAGGVDG